MCSDGLPAAVSPRGGGGGGGGGGTGGYVLQGHSSWQPSAPLFMLCWEQDLWSSAWKREKPLMLIIQSDSHSLLQAQSSCRVSGWSLIHRPIQHQIMHTQIHYTGSKQATAFCFMVMLPVPVSWHFIRPVRLSYQGLLHMHTSIFIFLSCWTMIIILFEVL